MSVGPQRCRATDRCPTPQLPPYPLSNLSNELECGNSNHSLVCPQQPHWESQYRYISRSEIPFLPFTYSESRAEPQKVYEQTDTNELLLRALFPPTSARIANFCVNDVLSKCDSLPLSCTCYDTTAGDYSRRQPEETTMISQADADLSHNEDRQLEKKTVSRWSSKSEFQFGAARCPPAHREEGEMIYLSKSASFRGVVGSTIKVGCWLLRWQELALPRR